MESLVVANLRARPVRTVTSVTGIALGVVLILVTVGLARGMLLSTGEREGNLQAEMLFLPPSGFAAAGVTSAPLTLPVAYATALESVPGVAETTPVARYVRGGARGIGFELIEGVIFEDGEEISASYLDMTGLTLRAGRLPESADEMVVDYQRAKDPTTRLGSRLELLGREFEIVGIYGPEVGARMKIPLGAMQELLGTDRKCSWILVKTEPGAASEEVATAIEAQFPGNQILFTRDIPGLYSRGIPSLTVFLKVVVGLAVFVSGLTIFLSLYTAITERTKEIGILKSLGGSKPFIVGTVQKEAAALSLLGIAMGVALAFAIRAGIVSHTALVVQFEWQWLGIASLLAVLGGLLGAFYPALKAAYQDPVEALSYE